MAWAFQGSTSRRSNPRRWVNGILYFTVPNHVWAVDARTGRQIWTFQRQSGGNMIGQRGVAMYKDRLYFGTPDAHLICLDARSGRQVWDIEVADYKFGYYISVTPIVVKDRLIMGMSNDQSDIPALNPGVPKRQGPVALGCGAKTGPAGFGNLAECRQYGSWRRRHLDSRIL
jgi:alcohol dehydrogenase (cytochrome c)